MNVDKLTAALAAFWENHSAEITLAALGVTAVFLTVALLVSWRRGRVDRWVSTLAGLSVLALSAEGMWVVATKTLGLPGPLAATVFFVAEAVMVNEAMQARRHYAKHRNPGKHGRAVWIIALVAGGIVAMNSASLVEIPLRLALPLAWCLMWWNDLTAEGVVAERSTWRWTPRRLLLALGAIEPGERDAETINRDRLTAAMTVTAHRVHAGGRFSGLHAARLRRLARTADDAIVTEVQTRVARVQRITELTDPATVAGQRAELVELEERHAAELAARTAEVETLRAELARVVELTAERERQQSADLTQIADSAGDLRAELLAKTTEADRLRADLHTERARRQRAETERTEILSGQSRQNTSGQKPPRVERTENLSAASGQKSRADERAETKGGQNQPTKADRSARTDEEILAEHGQELRAAHAVKPLTRYRVEQITGAGSRQAERVLTAITTPSLEVIAA